MDAAPLARLAPVLRAQDGVFTTRQASAADIPPATLSALVRRGLVEQLAWSVYRSTAVPDRWEGRALAALLSCGPAAALGRWSALFVHQLVARRPPDVDIVVPRGVQPRAPILTPRSSRRLLSDDVAHMGALRVTRPAWTLCDLAAVARPSTVAAIGGRALAAEAMTKAEFRATVRRFRYVTGVPRAREALEQVDPSMRGTRSDRERWFLEIARRFDLPLPRANVRVTDAAGRRRYLDFAYVELKVAIEIDVHPDHGTTIGRRADGRRQNDLVGEWLVLRFDEWDLRYDPEGVARQVRRALAAARQRIGTA